MKRGLEMAKNDSATTTSAKVEGYIVNVNVIKRNTNNDNHHYAFLVCTGDQSIARVTKFLSKVPLCTFRTNLIDSMRSGRGATISGLREDNGQYFCTQSTKLENKDLSFRPMCVRIQPLGDVKCCSEERLCTVEVKICAIGEETSITYEDIGFKRVQKGKKTVIVGDKTGALDMTLWENHFNEISLNDSFHIRLIKVRSYNDQISLVAIGDTSFMKIDDIGEVIGDLDRIAARFCSDEGQIVAVEKNFGQHICQGCGSSDITVEGSCLLCNMCRCRSPFEKDGMNECFKVTVVTDQKKEYSLKVPEALMKSLSSASEQTANKQSELTNEQSTTTLFLSLRVQFKYDQSTGFVHTIFPSVHPCPSVVQDSGNNVDELLNNNDTINR